MKAILISVQPKWCGLIASWKKKAEIRKTKPKIELPVKCYIYCTNSKRDFLQSRSNVKFYCENRDFIGGHGCGFYQRLNGKVIGEFICPEITEFESEFCDDETYERIKKIIKDSEHYAEYGEYEYETVATNEDDKYKENWLCKQSCVSWEEMRKYIGAGIKEFYGWHISDLVIYDKPKKLSCFRKWVSFLDGENTTELEEAGINNLRLKKPPQSWCYVEALKEGAASDE